MRLRYLFIFFINCLTLKVLGFQKLDSLYRVLSIQKDDSQKVITLTKIGKEQALYSPEKALQYTNKALLLSERINWDRGKALCYSILGDTYSAKGDARHALEYRLNEFKIWEKLKREDKCCMVLCNIGVAYSDLGNNTEALNYYHKAIKLAKKTKDQGTESDCLNNIATILQESGENEKAKEYYQKSLSLSIEINNEQQIANGYTNLGNLYGDEGDLSRALSYYQKALKIYEAGKDHIRTAIVIGNIGTIYYSKSDSALKKGEIFSAEKLQNVALTYFIKAVELCKITGNEFGQAEFLGNISGIYLIKKEYRLAEENLEKSLALARKINSPYAIMSAYERYIELFKETRKFEKALSFQEQYVALKDSVYGIEKEKVISELQVKYETEKKENEIKLLSKQSEVKELSIERNRYLTYGISLLLVCAVFIAIIIIRQNRLRARQTASGLEQKVLRTQMNPHFIFNSLENIESFIYEHQPKEAGVYLAKFARLMRLILENSESEYITLEKEVETLEYYLILQKVRLDDKLDYTITIDKHLQKDRVLLPPMLTQPFIENAIEHGFRGLKRAGIIEVIFTLEGKSLLVKIKDNGIGIVEAQKQKDLYKTHKSMAMKITQERLVYLNKSKKKKLLFSIEEIKSEAGGTTGTEVTFSIPIEDYGS
ncbi:MAG: tetratricopeptide repeat protein [Bacteroidetes bacterium]|nr:tetratricopeptide repeat protein [Bacteroidota bacterium]